MSNCKVKIVTLEDYERVMDINTDVYSGNDYLPVKYPHFFHGNDCKIYALEEDDLLVSFVIFKLNDDKKSVTTVAIRVRPTHQGLGLSVDKNPMLREKLKADVPSVRHEIYSTVRHEGTENKILHSALHRQWNVVGWRLFLKELSPAIFTALHPEVVSLSYSDVIRSLETTDKIPKFLSKYANEYIPSEANWIPTRIQFNDLKRLFAINNSFVTFEDSNGDENIQRDIFNSNIKAMSYCSSCPIPIGCKSDIFYYGDSSGIEGHVVEHFKHLVKIFDGLMCIRVHVSDSIDFTELIDIMQNINLLNAEGPVRIDRMHGVICSKDFY